MDENGSRMFVEDDSKAHTKKKEKYRKSLTRWAETEAGVIL